MENEFNNNTDSILPQGEEENIVGGFKVEENIFDDDIVEKVEEGLPQEDGQTEDISQNFSQEPQREEPQGDEPQGAESQVNEPQRNTGFAEDPQNNQGFQGAPVPPAPKKPYIPMGLTPEGFAEFKDLRKKTNAIAIASIAVMLISSLWVTVLYAITGLMGLSPLKVYDFISEPAALQYISVLLSSIMFTVPFIFAAKLTGHRISDLLPMGSSKKGKALPYFLFGIGFCAFANIATSMAGQIFSSFGIEYNVDSGDLPSGVLGFILSVLGTSLIPGFIEEFACRGVMFGMLKKYGDTFAIFATAAIFGLLHGNFVQMPFAFLVGLILGLIRVKTGSMRVCFAVHAANNFVSVIFDKLSGTLSVMETNILYVIYLVLCLLVAILGIVMLKDKDEFKLEAPEHICTAKQKYKWFFAAPSIIVFAVICIFESCMFFFV